MTCTQGRLQRFKAIYLLTFAGVFVYGQATGSISGTIADASGSAVAGAKVTVTATGTGMSRSTVTDDRGQYVVPLLAATVYTIQADIQGFQPAKAENVRLQVDEHPSDAIAGAYFDSSNVVHGFLRTP